MQSSFALCMGSSAFLIVDVTFYRQQHLFQVRSQPPCSGKFACLESHPSLATCNCATCSSCKSKVLLLFFQAVLAILPIWDQICTANAAVQEPQFWDCYQLAGCKTLALLLWLLMWHFVASSIFFKFEASHHAVVNLLVLRAALVLPLAIVPLFQLQKQSATAVPPSCACNSAHLRPRSVQQMRLCKNHNFGTATS